jgi:hypothetical protein
MASISYTSFHVGFIAAFLFMNETSIKRTGLAPYVVSEALLYQVLRDIGIGSRHIGSEVFRVPHSSACRRE